jgi:hypothetical protein
MVYGASTIKRDRRTRAEVEHLQDNLVQVLKDDHPQTVRGVFYQATVRGLVPKSEDGYRVVQRQLVVLRQAGRVPWGHIADSTRWQRKPDSYDSGDEILKDAAKYYRKAIWRDQNVELEIWIEKDALSGVIYEVTSEWDVPLMVSRGYSSLSFLYETAEAIEYSEKPFYIYTLTDYDGAGDNISKNIEKRLREYAPNSEIHFKRLAVTAEQIREWKLPTRPPKSRDAEKFKDGCVELDAIPAWRLRDIVRNAIESHIDHGALIRTRLIENAERQSFHNLAMRWEG